MVKVVQARGGVTGQRRMWPCKDGYIICFYHSGANASRHNLPLVRWMDEEEMADDFLKRIDWDALDLRTATQEVLNRIAEPTGKFFMAHTKAELLEGAVKRGVQLYPVATTKDILESAQLAAREFWVEVEHPELGTTITYPGATYKLSEAPWRIWNRAPLIGEHNEDIYLGELGMTGEKLNTLKQAKVI